MNPDLSADNEELLHEILEKVDAWNLAAHQVIDEYYHGEGCTMTVIDRLLFMSAKSYYDDLAKFKYYTGSHSTENPKKAAFTLKWISKNKPIQVVPKDSKSQDIDVEALAINNLLVLKCACNYFETFGFEDMMSEHDLIEELFYNLTYRDVCGKGYTLTFRLIEKLMSYKSGIHDHP